MILIIKHYITDQEVGAALRSTRSRAADGIKSKIASRGYLSNPIFDDYLFTYYPYLYDSIDVIYYSRTLWANFLEPLRQNMDQFL